MCHSEGCENEDSETRRPPRHCEASLTFLSKACAREPLPLWLALPVPLHLSAPLPLRPVFQAPLTPQPPLTSRQPFPSARQASPDLFFANLFLRATSSPF